MIDNQAVEIVQQYKYLGMVTDNKLCLLDQFFLSLFYLLAWITCKVL